MVEHPWQPGGGILADRLARAAAAAALPGQSAPDVAAFVESAALRRDICALLPLAPSGRPALRRSFTANRGELEHAMMLALVRFACCACCAMSRHDVHAAMRATCGLLCAHPSHQSCRKLGGPSGGLTGAPASPDFLFAAHRAKFCRCVYVCPWTAPQLARWTQTRPF